MKHFLLLLLLSFSARADIILPAILNSNMVLQQQTDVRLWGWASPGEKLTITPGWDAPPVTTTASENAAWNVTVRTPAAGGPYRLTFKGQNEIVLSNILIGEVWLCAGQSNMEWSAALGTIDANEELPKAYNPNIRFFDMPKLAANSPQDDTKGMWTVCDSVTLKPFSAVGYFFGKKLQQSLNVPIGLIDVAWGGSYIESWIPTEIINLYADTRLSAERMGPVRAWPVKAGLIYNAMVAPLTNFRLAGALWYQGESNRHYPQSYYHLMHLMADAWRGVWQQDFPLYYVQIAPFTYNGQQQAAAVREAQTRAMDIPKSGMIVVTDLVDNLRDIHPKYKREVGNRLAAWALAETYGQKTGSYRSPQYRSMQVVGDRIRLTFDHAPNGLVTRNGEPAEFEIAGADRTFVKARAQVKGNTVEVWADGLKGPVAVRFAFRDAPEPNLFSREGLPVVPFRTDDWDLGLKP